MLKLGISNIISKIKEEVPFEAVSEDYSFTIKIDAYAPYICGAVHDGHQFRRSLWENCLHSEYERWYEEDPCTKEMVRSHPIVIAGCDSRFEYDLNRAPETAIYTDAWGKQLWKNPLSQTERNQSLGKHTNFYEVVTALVHQIEAKYGKAIVFDMHSYNWKRWDREVPTWNLGTANIDNDRYGGIADSWSKKLGGMQLPNGIKSTSKINDTFQGNGYFLKYITQNFDNTLVLATEISKVYCDELSGILYPEVVRSVEEQLKELIPLQAQEFHDSDLWDLNGN
ncbi:N-formylglutamate amidohydrolase [Flavobacteriaceae bacterium TP-CH-4]|uniref:N-formylglutamate amidohydrolase n=1 Tax=Pelagihabitans pacificus TaxID=2696054 RepID=A0A967AU83_9FLAO|nr:N-formylglutamate amidohydrolase [Pelagihabitans pacificus]NHF60037.1 N-formylglutamate amidohydrolase [Pelagihabitans pacificus]